MNRVEKSTETQTNTEIHTMPDIPNNHDGPQAQPPQAPANGTLVRTFLAELRYYIDKIGKGLKELGLAVQIVVAMSLLAIVALLFTKVADFTFTVYALTFVALNVFVLLEIRSTPDKKHLKAIDDATTALDTASQSVLAQNANRFLQRFQDTESTIRQGLKQQHSAILERLRDQLGEPRRPLWQIVQYSIIFFFIACLIIAGMFLYF